MITDIGTKMTDAKESIDKISLLAAKSILKNEKDESAVVDIGYQYCDKFNELIEGVIKILKESPKKNDISHIIKNLEKIRNLDAIDHNGKIVKIEDQRKWTAKQWIDWAKKIKKKK